ncbi:MAG: hypothetical protein WD872_11820 [Pirellulaceae bacterium]
MSVRSTVTLAGVAAIMLILGSRWCRERAVALQTLRVEAKELTLGEVWLQEPIRRTLNVHNTSMDIVRVAAFDGGCVCTAVSPSSMELAAGESKPLEVTIDPLLVADDNASASKWPLAITIKARTGDARTDSSWRLQGKLVSPLAPPVVQPALLKLVRTDPPRTVSLPIRLKPGMVLKRVTSKTDGVSIAFKSVAADRAVLNVRIDPAQMEAGDFAARNLLHIQDTRGNSLPPLPLDVVGSVRASVALEPAVLLAGIRQSADTVLIRSAIGKRFQVLGVGNCEGLTTELLPGDEYAAERSLRIACTRPDEKMEMASLVIDVRSEGSRIDERITLSIQRPGKLLFQTARTGD